MMKLAALLLTVMAGSSLAQGFTDTSKSKASIEREEKLNNSIGKTFTLMPNPAGNSQISCVKHFGFEFLDKPSLHTKNLYESKSPIEYRIEAIVPSSDEFLASSKYLKLMIADKTSTVAYIRDHRFYVTTFDGKTSTALRGCNFEGNIEAVQSKLKQAQNGISPAVGMSYQMVENETEWGSPTKINTLQTATGTQSQWVYDNFWKRGFLYFNSQGVLTAIQEQ